MQSRLAEEGMAEREVSMAGGMAAGRGEEWGSKEGALRFAASFLWEVYCMEEELQGEP